MIRLKHLVPTWELAEEKETVIDPHSFFSQVAALLHRTHVTSSWCWLLDDGYGLAIKGRRPTVTFAGQKVLAYRAVFMIFNDCIWPDPLCRHLCGNEACINPEHLSIGDTEDNTLDRQFHASGGFLAPVDWYKEGKRNTPSIAASFGDHLTGMGWGDHFIEYLEKYGILDAIIWNRSSGYEAAR